LRWSDADWQRRTLGIDRSLTVIRRVVSQGPTKTHQRWDIAIHKIGVRSHFHELRHFAATTAIASGVDVASAILGVTSPLSVGEIVEPRQEQLENG
jgi:integrase